MRLLAFLLAFLVAAPPAWAEADEAALARARKAFKKGEKLYALGKFEEALRQYEKAYEESELPELLFNIGQCHRNLTHYDEAIFSYKKYLRDKPDAENRVAVEKLVDELTEARRKREAARPKEPPRQRLDPVPNPNEPEVTPQPVYEEDSPFYGKWWFWTGVVVVGGAVAAGVLLLPGEGGVPASDLGNLEFPR